MLATQPGGALVNSAIETIDYMRVRHHPEKPHISTIAPPLGSIYRKLWSRCLPRHRAGTYTTEVEEGQEEEEDVIGQLAQSKYPGFVFGAIVDADDSTAAMGVSSGSTGIPHVKVAFEFYLRNGPDFDDSSKWDESAYSKARIEITYYPPPKGVADVMWKFERLFKNEGGTLLPKALSQSWLGLAGNYVLLIFVPTAVSDCLSKEAAKEQAASILDVAARETSSNYSSDEIKVYQIVDNQLDDYLTAVVYDEKGEELGYYYQAFAIFVGKISKKVLAHLINLGGIFKRNSDKRAAIRLEKVLAETPSRAFTYNFNDNGSRWALGYLLEVGGQLEFVGGTHLVSWDPFGIKGIRTFNAMAVIRDDNPARILLQDYLIASEDLEGLELGHEVDMVFDEFLRRISCPSDKQTFASFLKALRDAVKGLGIQKLYKFQEDAWYRILEDLGVLASQGGSAQRSDALVITARTAAGKTYAFLVPALIYIAYNKICRSATRSVLLVYPTKALANDQLEELAHLLYRLNKHLSGAPLGHSLTITFGMLHGSTPKADELQRGGTQDLPITCPLHHKTLSVQLTKAAPGSGGPVRVSAICTVGGSCDFADFINQHMRKIREEVYYEPPDILITDEDMINRILSGTSSVYEWQLLGYGYLRCPNCGLTLPGGLKDRVNKCPNCKADLEFIASPPKPGLIVIDEAHQLYGSFGIQVHHLLSLLEYVLGDRPYYVLSSATLSRPQEFAATLLGLQATQVAHIEARPAPPQAGAGKGTAPSVQRTYLFIMPKTYDMAATMSTLLAKFYEKFSSRVNRMPKGIIFTNTLDENNELTQSLRSHKTLTFLGVRIGGHSTDYEEERARKEQEFKRGNIDLFIATSTLELGVDYGSVDFVGIYGAPFKISSFVQRIGRAGRAGRSALIFVVFDPDVPINYYYYENYRLLYDDKLRSGAMAHEVNVISPFNEEALRRAVSRWLIAYVRYLCATQRANNVYDVCKFISNGKFISNAIRLKPAQARQILSQLAMQLDIIRKQQQYHLLPRSLARAYAFLNNVLESMLDGIVTSLSNWSQQGTIRSLNDLVQNIGTESLHSLRVADAEVAIIFNGFGQRQTRRRELRYAIRHGLYGMVLAYRGRFFYVQAIDGQSKDLERWL